MSSRSTAKKTLQSFHARTVLWNLFENRAREMECSVDYLINEAMRLYATAHNFLEGTNPSMMQDIVDYSATGSGGDFGRPTSPAQRPAPPVPRPSGRMNVPVPATSTSPPAVPRPGGPVTAPPVSNVGLPRPSVGSSIEQGSGLTLIFQGKKIPIRTAQFIIGRGSKSSDLTIKDANISRKHAAIIFHNGAFYLKDLGSTNGIEYKGKQVDSKRIDEGDVFSICGYDLHFTYSV